ncbi:hypothetical protein FRC10_004496 [Ceratobasidium sp. 414]|nr:hypothetical protein FRC10_004496 [Ceratobasidium sp. 414]
MQGFRPPNRPPSKGKKTGFDHESHFVLLKGGEYYRCMICTGNPDFPTLAAAIKHESIPEHVQAQRQLDRAPPPVQLDSVFGSDTLDYVPILGSPHDDPPPGTTSGLGHKLSQSGPMSAQPLAPTPIPHNTSTQWAPPERGQLAH